MWSLLSRTDGHLFTLQAAQALPFRRHRPGSLQELLTPDAATSLRALSTNTARLRQDSRWPASVQQLQ
jgi:hypothetical protein